MVRIYAKGVDLELSMHFKLHEFDCRCQHPSCRTTLIDTDLILALETLRGLVGTPIRIYSGYRCSKHNAETDGAKAGSIHLIGKAADIKADLSPAQVAELAENIVKFASGGIGRYPTFTHLDIRGYRARWQG